MHRRTLLAATATPALAAIAGCTGDQGERPDAVTLEIDTEDSWSSTIDTDGGHEKIGGQGDDTIEWSHPFPGNLRVTIKKGPQQNVPLEATFYADDEAVQSKSTSKPYESVIMTYVPGTI
ncbi:hypothetical protein [Halorubellus salinus]|uniref:hypothetical protein n=1 Tax=Halorubellus salinus TaxID=755309 RepID=UPI001D069B72|nr:hypothetical protein [Halorubellus salinus]